MVLMKAEMKMRQMKRERENERERRAKGMILFSKLNGKYRQKCFLETLEFCNRFSVRVRMWNLNLG